MLFHPIEWHFAPSVSKLTSDESTRGHGSCTASKATVSVAFAWCHLLLRVSLRCSSSSFPPCPIRALLTSTLSGLDLWRVQKLAPHSTQIGAQYSRHTLLLLHRPRRHHCQREEAEIRHLVSPRVCRSLQPVHRCPKELGCYQGIDPGGLRQRRPGCSAGR